MPRQLIGSWPKTERRYVPQAYGESTYREKDHLVSFAVVRERGPDVQITLHIRGLPCTPIEIPARDEQPFLAQVFRDAPAEDRSRMMELLQQFEDAILQGDAGAMVLAWRKVMAVYDTMAADLAAIAGRSAA